MTNDREYPMVILVDDEAFYFNGQSGFRDVPYFKIPIGLFDSIMACASIVDQRVGECGHSKDVREWLESIRPAVVKYWQESEGGSYYVD